ncbi:VRR-NUC domain-containing protein [Veronia nyctiphanis]|uniref:phosphodiesterase I n=1 Tax=Veronia nyctiphanis TaxID=1278244 RepID=A0A4Q0Z0I2_9GAMM|nr:VRR-NUC domain-containing protein [Veronia nyctiphanis]RXJ74921.1 VRR-NUC domain-containing protein [Veronia nyctiphanis]
MPTEKTPPPVLPDFYYLNNFLTLIEYVAQQYTDLLNENEKAWIDCFQMLPRDGKALTVRLLSRRGIWFREDKLKYSEIKDLSATLAELERVGFVSLSNQPATEVACDLLTKPELVNLLSDCPLKKQEKKQVFVDYALETKPTLTLPFQCIALHHQEIMPVFLLLFFGNAHQDLSQFVLSDLGIHQYEDVEISKAYRLFRQRKHITDWLSLSELSEQLWLATTAKDIPCILGIASSVQASTAFETIEWQPMERKRQRLLTRIGRELERQSQLDDAVLFYQQSALPPARERLARIYTKQNRLALAADIVKDMLESPVDEDEQETAGRIARQLAKKTEINAPEKIKAAFESETVSLSIGRSVELTVAEYYQSQGWQAWYSENLLLNAVFGLTFWDIIFSPVEGAFLNPFQRSPRDMYHESFSSTRKDMLESRFRQITQHGLDYIFGVYKEKHGTSNDWVNWHYVTEELLSAAINSLSSAQWVGCFRRLLFDLRANRKGHPDLFMVKEGKPCFIEVKGPGDSLQYHQIRWLNYFDHLGIECKVVYVESATQ